MLGRSWQLKATQAAEGYSGVHLDDGRRPPDGPHPQDQPARCASRHRRGDPGEGVPARDPARRWSCRPLNKIGLHGQGVGDLLRLEQAGRDHRAPRGDREPLSHAVREQADALPALRWSSPTGRATTRALADFSITSNAGILLTSPNLPRLSPQRQSSRSSVETLTAPSDRLLASSSPTLARSS